MKTLREFDKSNGYVGLKVSEKSTDNIREVLEKYNIKDMIDSLHLTLIYDESNPDIDIPRNDTLYKSDAIDIKMLGDKDSEWRAVVIELGGTKLESRHKELLSMGFKHSYDNFIAHVSIKYKPTPEDGKILITNRKDILRNLNMIELGDEYSEKIK